MRIAVCSDEPYAIHDLLRADVESRGHVVVPFGAVASGEDEPWPGVAEAAAKAVASGQCDEGIFCCWTGTGISMAANKVAGIRAALCTDPATAAGARTWNHANVLALSNRLLGEHILREILDSWFGTPARSPEGLSGVESLADLDRRTRR